MEILDVDLLAFESGSPEARRAVVDGVSRSLVTGFVYVEHDLSVDLAIASETSEFEVLAKFEFDWPLLTCELKRLVGEIGARTQSELVAVCCFTRVRIGHEREAERRGGSVASMQAPTG